MINKHSTLLTGLMLLLVGCASSQRQEPPWYVDLAAPKHYDVWVSNFELEASGIRHWRQPGGITTCCWRGPSGPRGSGGEMDPIPNYMAIWWFSFAEQKFYTASIIVPENLKQQMLETAPKKVGDSIRYEPRNFLVLGLAPGGEVVMWIMNQVGNEVEIARQQAVEIEGDASQYQTRTKSYLERNGAYIEEHGIPLGGW